MGSWVCGLGGSGGVGQCGWRGESEEETEAHLLGLHYKVFPYECQGCEDGLSTLLPTLPAVQAHVDFRHGSKRQIAFTKPDNFLQLSAHITATAKSFFRPASLFPSPPPTDSSDPASPALHDADAPTDAPTDAAEEEDKEFLRSFFSSEGLLASQDEPVGQEPMGLASPHESPASPPADSPAHDRRFQEVLDEIMAEAACIDSGLPVSSLGGLDFSSLQPEPQPKTEPREQEQWGGGPQQPPAPQQVPNPSPAPPPDVWELRTTTPQNCLLCGGGQIRMPVRHVLEVDRVFELAQPPLDWPQGAYTAAASAIAGSIADGLRSAFPGLSHPALSPANLLTAALKNLPPSSHSSKWPPSQDRRHLCSECPYNADSRRLILKHQLLTGHQPGRIEPPQQASPPAQAPAPSPPQQAWGQPLRLDGPASSAGPGTPSPLHSGLPSPSSFPQHSPPLLSPAVQMRQGPAPTAQPAMSFRLQRGQASSISYSVSRESISRVNKSRPARQRKPTASPGETCARVRPLELEASERRPTQRLLLGPPPASPAALAYYHNYSQPPSHAQPLSQPQPSPLAQAQSSLQRQLLSSTYQQPGHLSSQLLPQPTPSASQPSSSQSQAQAVRAVYQSSRGPAKLRLIQAPAGGGPHRIVYLDSSKPVRTLRLAPASSAPSQISQAPTSQAQSSQAPPSTQTYRHAAPPVLVNSRSLLLQPQH